MSNIKAQGTESAQQMENASVHAQLLHNNEQYQGAGSRICLTNGECFCLCTKLCNAYPMDGNHTSKFSKSHYNLRSVNWSRCRVHLGLAVTTVMVLGLKASRPRREQTSCLVAYMKITFTSLHVYFTRNVLSSTHMCKIFGIIYMHNAR
jgi:hypothetical protein